ncbi:DMT family transporter [Actibacterium sp. XHP0104]|uniref:DMT family transporter n=1 Tax=Actibacterium sp. XHP0104 TaxID=2984335 RepID=UPI0021E788B8|nr:DMT family transporter [Actibacterium sp. XHP0104]MCV2881548.1 DMT family transporter [Actibacterium sp. XHP0104]
MENLRGIIMMTVSMAGFALEDMFIKLASEHMPVGQIMMILGAAGAFIFFLFARRHGLSLFARDLFTAPVLLRNLGEIVAGVGFITAIALTPISSASAILQATPLAVTLGAAIVFKAQVGWRRWLAIGIGMIGVLMVVQPGLDGFQPASLFAVIAVAGLALRDLSVRRVPATLSSLQLAAWGFAVLVPVGAVMLAISGGATPVTGQSALYLLGASVMGPAGYYAVVEATRIGDVAVVTPFRYFRLLFAMIVGVTVFSETPDVLTLTGAAIIITSGLYTFLRERRLLRQR